MYLLNSMDTLCGIVGHDTARIICRMKETWMDRAKRRMGILGKTQEDLKAALGVKTRGAVGHYFTGRRDLNTKQVIALADELDYSIDELLTGKQPSISSDTRDIPSHIVHLARCITDTSSDKAKAIQLIADAPKEKVHAILVLLGEKSLDPPTQRRKTLGEKRAGKIRCSPHVIIKDPKRPINPATRKRRGVAGGDNHD